MQPELAAGVCVKLTMKFIFELASVAFSRRCAWGHGLHTSSGVAFAGMQCFDDDDQEPFCHEDEWEADEDVDQMRELAEAEAAALGLTEDGLNEVSLPLITSSSSPSGSDLLVTPPRRQGAQVDNGSFEKRCAPDMAAESGSRKRLRFKQACIEPAPQRPLTITIDGKPLKSHGLYVRYFKMSANNRRTTSKRVSQQKYRLVSLLVEHGSVEIYGEMVTYEGEAAEAAAQIEHKFFLGLAKDETKAEADRGYAMAQLAVCERDIILCDAVERKTRIVRSVPSALLTYIGECGVVDINSVTVPSPGRPQSSHGLSVEEKFGILRSMNVDDVAALLRSHSQVAKFHTELQTHAVNTVNKVHAPHWAVAVEVCGKTLEKSDVLRFHGHVWVMLNNQALDLIAVAVDEGRCVPYANWAALRFLSGTSARSATAAMAGAWYCTSAKKGSIVQSSTCQPWIDFAVRDAWITSMYAADKILFEVARSAYIQTVHNARANVAQLEFCHGHRQKQALQLKMRRIEEELRETMFPWRVLPDVTKWDKQYDSKLGRYLFLILDGESWFGKTKFALSLQALGSTFYCDCTAGIPDLRDFDGERFSSILFDELSPKEGIKLKKVLQSSNEPTVLGVSPTMMNAYTVHVWRTRIIVCTNLWATGTKKMRKVDRNWLAKNSVYISVKEPLWVQPPKGLPVPHNVF